MAPSSLGSRPRPPGGLRPALTPAPGDAHRQRRGAGSPTNPGLHAFRGLPLVVRLRFDLAEGFAAALDLGDDVFGGGFPDEWFGVGVPVFGPGGDGVAEFGDAGEGAAA